MFAANSGAVSDEKLYVEDVFSTYLYKGNGSTQRIENGVALASASGWSTAKVSGGSGNYNMGVTVDSSGNIYTTGYSYNGSNYTGYIIKYDSGFNVQWQRSLGTSGLNSNGYASAVDSSGNVYVTGNHLITGAGNRIFVAKYNSSGVLQWQRRLAPNGNYEAGGRSIALDSSGNVYVNGFTAANGATQYGTVVKYDPSGTLLWQNLTGGGGAYGAGAKGIGVDSSGNVYSLTEASSGTSSGYLNIVKMNTSGTTLWARSFTAAGSTRINYGYSLAIDSSGNSYIAGGYANGSNGYLIKYNSSGTIQWQKKLSSFNLYVNDVTTDSSGNVYIFGYMYSGQYSYIVKFDSSGNVLWQRHLELSGSSTPAYGGTTDSSGNVYITGYVGTTAYTSKLKQDGTSSVGQAFLSLSDRGSNAQYGITVAAGDGTDAAGTNASTASSIDSANNLTDSAGSLTTSIAIQNDIISSGGMVWVKSRSNDSAFDLYDTARGTSSVLSPPFTSAASPNANSILSFNSSGFTLGSQSSGNGSGNADVSWTFRKAPKFFDVVTWTGNDTYGRAIPHNLGTVPGMIIVKNITQANTDWYVLHRSMVGTMGVLNQSLAFAATQSNAAATGAEIKKIFGDGTNYIAPTATSFTVGEYSGTGEGSLNQSSVSYVAYLFAHDTTTDGLIQCGSYTGNGSATGPTVSLGWEPQYLMIKNASGTGSWQIIDNMRGMPVGYADATLTANAASVESSVEYVSPTATGFQITSTSSEVNTSSATYIYMAIRRGPMRTPTDGTKVFSPVARTGTGAAGSVTTPGFPVDAWWWGARTNKTSFPFSYRAYSRLTGSNSFTYTDATNASENDGTSIASYSMTGIDFSGNGNPNINGIAYSDLFFKRAPGFFDVVCWTGNGSSSQTITHNLSVVPEMIIAKKRSGLGDWWVYHSGISSSDTSFARLNTNQVPANTGLSQWNVTKTSFKVTLYGSLNDSGGTCVAYLFATCPGVSKVGSFVGNGTTQTIDCGFTTGARFVLMKRTDTGGAGSNWYVWDTARGIVSGNDPLLNLDTTSAEVTGNDYIDPSSTGFIINADASNINVNNATYIYLAIA